MSENTTFGKIRTKIYKMQYILTFNSDCVIIIIWNQISGKEDFIMSKKIAAIIAKAARFSACITCNTTSTIGGYQPTAPKQLKSTKPEKK